MSSYDGNDAGVRERDVELSAVLTFAMPWAFWLLPMPMIVWWLMPPRSVGRVAVRVPFAARLRRSGVESVVSSSPRTVAKWLLPTFVWLMVMVALARPQWLEPPVERTIPTRDLLLLIDLSASMDQPDFTDAAGNAIDRLSAAKEVLGEFLSRREGDRVGLVVFGNSPFLQVPFTTDLELCRKLLDETAVGMAGPRTALGDAIGLGIGLFENNETPNKTIITLTDGNDTSSAVPPIEAAKVAQDREITIHTVAMGDPTTVGEEKLDLEALQAVATRTGGLSFLAMNRAELEQIYARLDENESREIQTVSHRPKRDLYFWPIAAALVASLAVNVARWWRMSRSVLLQQNPIRLRVNPRTFELERVE